MTRYLVTSALPYATRADLQLDRNFLLLTERVAAADFVFPNRLPVDQQLRARPVARAGIGVVVIERGAGRATHVADPASDR